MADIQPERPLRDRFLAAQEQYRGIMQRTHDESDGPLEWVPKKGVSMTEGERDAVDLYFVLKARWARVAREDEHARCAGKVTGMFL